MIDTLEYQLAKFLDSIFKHYIPNLYIIQSRKEFLNKIDTFHFISSNQFLVSFDVKLVFTNVLLTLYLSGYFHTLFVPWRGEIALYLKTVW